METSSYLPHLAFILSTYFYAGHTSTLLKSNMSNWQGSPNPEPIFLYFDPHPVHEKMAERVGAELVECQTGGPIDRIKAGASHRFGDRPVILEGGVPLLEGAALKLFGESGPIIALGADSTYDDLVDPLPGRSRRSRLAHRVSLPFVDGTLAVSERIATITEQFSGSPVRITHPFVQAERYKQLRSLDTDPTGDRILCVGKYRTKNGQYLLREAVEQTSLDITVDFVGPDTEQIEESDKVSTHGFVAEERLYELFESASLMVFPAPVGAFPVVTLEALCAGLPIVTTSRIGTATLIRGINGRLVADPTVDDIARAIRWYFTSTESKRKQLADQAKLFGSGFRESEGLEAFESAFNRILHDIGYKGAI